ncbi:MAG: CHRD domain-containing protein [Bryobacteraceae bacterium]
MRTLATAGCIVCLSLAGLAVADSRARSVHANLSGFQEVPAVSTVARGDFVARVNPANTELRYEISYSDLEGSVTMAHIHLGQKSVNGGIMIWLCGTAGVPGPAGTPVCPVSGSVTRTVTAADVVGPSGQGVDAGQFAEALRAIRAGFAYANVHSSKWPGGEIRGQIRDEDND